MVWSGDIYTRKISSISWYQVCLPWDAGGLDLKSTRSINESFSSAPDLEAFYTDFAVFPPIFLLNVCGTRDEYCFKKKNVGDEYIE